MITTDVVGGRMKQKASIVLYLNAMKKYVRDNGVILVPRDQNIEFMAERGMTMEDLKGIIFCLETCDCFDGPEPDRDERYADWTVAEFSPTFQGERLYLKTSIKVSAERCKCLSVKLYAEKEDGDGC